MSGFIKNGNKIEKNFVGSTTPTTTQSFTYSKRVENLLNNINKIMPTGATLAYIPGYFTNTNNGGITSVIPGSVFSSIQKKIKKIFCGVFEICDGSTCENTNSIWSFKNKPKLDDERFIMGETTSLGTGLSGGTNKILEHVHYIPAGFSQKAVFSGGANWYGGHTHTSTATESSYGRLQYHYFVTHMYHIWGEEIVRFATGNDATSAGSPCDTSYYSHFHNNMLAFMPSTFSGSASLPSWNHSHPSSILSGSVGTGNFCGDVNNSDHKPNFLTCLYIMKVE